jgi:hypothetical protein
MLKIDDSVISLEIFEKKFLCDIKKCKGVCCVHGDSGAPLEENEVEILAKIYPKVKPFMRDESIKAIEEQGTSVVDKDGDIVTPLLNGEECAYVLFQDSIAKCTIELAWEAKKIKFQKPISCHLYPIRITKYKDFEALNYHEWDICKSALALGKKKDLPLHIFLKEPLVRKYGTKWFRELKVISNKALKNKVKKVK